MKMNQVIRRTLSLLLCLCMVLGMGVTAFAAEVSTRAAGGAHVLIDFRAGSAERNYGWKVKNAASNSSNITWGSAADGVMEVAFSGKDSYVYMPADGTNRLNHVITQTDVVVVRLRMKNPPTEKKAVSSQVFFATDASTSYSNDKVMGTNTFEMTDQEWQILNFGTFPAANVGKTLQNIRLDLFGDSITATVEIDQIYVGDPADAPSYFVSNKTLTNGKDEDPDTFTIELDAYSKGFATKGVTVKPLDVCIVYDRSQSMSFPASEDAKEFWKVNVAGNTTSNINDGIAALNNVLAKLDKEKGKLEGYYRATNMLKRYGVNGWFAGEEAAPGYVANGYASYEPMRYNTSSQKWEMQITTGNWTADVPGGIATMELTGTNRSIAGTFVKWVTMEEAYKEYVSRTATIISKGRLSKYYPFQIGVPRLTRTHEATVNFVSALYESSKQLGNGLNHTVSVVGYGQGVFVKGQKYYYKVYDKVADNAVVTQGVLQDELGVSVSQTTLNSDANYNKIVNALKNDYTYETTRTDDALALVKSSNSYLPASSEGRKRVVILVTDGGPTDGTGIKQNICNTALTNAKALKDTGAEIYTIGVMSGLNDSLNFEAWKDAQTYFQKCNNFLLACSSAYPGANNMTGTFVKNESSKYFLADDGSGSMLAEHFKSILDNILPTFWTPVEKSLYIYDEITREFMVDSQRPVRVYMQAYTGNGNFNGDRIYIDNDGFYFTPDANKTVDCSKEPNYGYILQWDCDIPHEDASQPDVNLSTSSMSLKWTDAINATIREVAVTLEGSAHSEQILGYKIGMEIPVVVNRNNTLGGNNILTNVITSGLYQSNSDDTGKGDFEEIYDVPNANVKADFSTLVYDYFMDLETMVANLNAGVNSSFAQAIFAAMLQDPAALLSYLNNNKNDYVNLSIQLEDLLALIANAGADAFTSSGPASGATFDFTIDQMLEALVKLTYTSNKTDSIGVAPFQNVTTTLNPNYYGPKYVVVDFDETVKTPLDKEGGLNPALQSGVTNGKIEGTNICYNFRANYASGAKSYLEKNYTTVKYQVTAINAPKSQPTNKTVKRNFYVIPANVMTYDDTFLSFVNGGWETVGTYTDSEQSHDNAVIHGYDALYNGTYSKDYYHNALKAVTVSSTKGTAQATFNFTGTGFDIFAQTSPNSGTIAVEVCTDAAFKNDSKTFIVDTYLKDATLNQIPVVRIDGLTYGTWYVRITAFYDKIFDHNLSKRVRGGEPTEAKLRELFGIAADADFTFVPSASGYDHGETRAIANAKNGQYNVYIDGIRVYNTLGTSLNAVAAYAYAQAGEGVANILNMNDALVDATNANAWADSAVSGINGVLYTAASKSTSNETAVTDGIILGLEGALYTKQDGSKFYVFKDAACTQNVKYNGKNVYCRKQALTSPNNRDYNGLNYYYDGGSASKPMTMVQVREAFGSMPVYYNAKYSQYGPEKEVYLNSTNGVAFKVGTGAKKVMISLKSHNGSTATLNIYNPGTKSFVKLAATTSRVEMYYDITKYVNAQGYVYLKNAGGITAVCNIKTIGAVSRGITVDRDLMAWVQEIDSTTLPVDDSAKILHSLNLASHISLNYFVPTAKLADYDRSYMEVSFKGETFSIEPEIRGDYGYFTVDGITAVDMTEELTATLHMFLGEEEFVSETDVYCVADYAYAQLAKTDVSDELKAVCANLLRYGALAQSFKGSDNAPADAAMTAEHKAYVTNLDTVSVASAAKALGDVENGVAWAGKALVLDSKVAVKAVFNLEGFAGNKEALNLRVTYTNAKGEEVALVIDTMDVYNADAQQYAFVIDSLLATEMRSELTMALYEGDTQVSETQIYSVESYCVGKIGTLADLGKALLAYSDAAKAFFAK